MGADNSVELPKPFADISKWPKNRVESVIKAYYEGEYDFGIDFNVVMSITGYDHDEAKELLAAHSKNDSGIINAVTLLVSIVSLGNCENRNEQTRLEHIFDLIDFNRATKVSFDELTILLLCLGSSYSFILEGQVPEEQMREKEQKIIAYAKFIYDTLKKRSNALITKEEFMKYVKEHFFGNGIYYINDIYHLITNDPIDTKKDGENEDKEGGGGGAGSNEYESKERSSSPPKGRKK